MNEDIEKAVAGQITGADVSVTVDGNRALITVVSDEFESLTRVQKQQKVYDQTLNAVKRQFGSYHQIALRIYANCEREVTGETVRQWFFDRRVPTLDLRGCRHGAKRTRPEADEQKHH